MFTFRRKPHVRYHKVWKEGGRGGEGLIECGVETIIVVVDVICHVVWYVIIIVPFSPKVQYMDDVEWDLWDLCLPGQRKRHRYSCTSFGGGGGGGGDGTGFVGTARRRVGRGGR